MKNKGVEKMQEVRIPPVEDQLRELVANCNTVREEAALYGALTCITAFVNTALWESFGGTVPPELGGVRVYHEPTLLPGCNTGSVYTFKIPPGPLAKTQVRN